MAPRYYSTEEAARKLGVTRAGLHKAIKEGRIKPPRQKIGRVLAWTAADIRRFKYKAKHYRKGRGRKKGARK